MPLPDHETKTDHPLIALQLGTTASFTPRSYSGLSREGVQRNAVAYRCVRLIAEAAASVEICAKRDGACVPGDPVARLLRAGNPAMDAATLMETFYGYLQVGGDSYLEAALVDGVPRALSALRPDRVSIRTNAQGWPVAYDYQAQTQRRINRDPVTDRCAVFHLRLFHPQSDHHGLAPLSACAQAVDIHNQGGAWTKALLDNSARPSGALIYRGPTGADRLTDEQFNRLKAELEGNHAGAASAGRPMLLEGGLDWTSMSMSPADMDFIEARREAAREIALAFGVPPMLLGIPGDNTYSNYREANQAFWRQTVIPLVTKTASAMGKWLRPYFGEDLTLHPELDRVPALSEERARLWHRVGDAPFLTDPERRVLAGLDPKAPT